MTFNLTVRASCLVSTVTSLPEHYNMANKTMPKKRLLSISFLLGSEAFQPTSMRGLRSFTKESSSVALYASNVDQHQKALDNARSLAWIGAIGAIGVSIAGLSPEAMHPLHLTAMQPWHLEHSSAFVHLATQANALTHCNLFYVEPIPPTPMQVAVQHMLAMLGKAAPPPPLPERTATLTVSQALLLRIAASSASVRANGYKMNAWRSPL